MEVVQAYLNAEGGYRYLASKYNIPAKRRIEEWVHAYREFGEEGLMRSRQNKKYTFQFKLSMVELYLSSEVSYQELALSQGISNPSLIVKWVNDFRIAGPDALRPKKKGRKKTLDIRECKKPSKYDGEKPVDTSAEHVKELEDELLKLRIENAYLKELRRLRFRGGNSSEKTARIVHSLRGQFKLKDILAIVGFPKGNIYVLAKSDLTEKILINSWRMKSLKFHIENKDYGYRRVYRELRNRKIFS